MSSDVGPAIIMAPAVCCWLGDAILEVVTRRALRGRGTDS